MVRKLARDGEAMLATALSTLGVKKKRSARRRSSAAVEKELAAMFVSGQVTDPFETIAQLMGRAVRTEDAKPDAATAKPTGELPDVPPF